MSRASASRRRLAHAVSRDTTDPAGENWINDSEERLDQLDAENHRLQEALTEVEAWYRLLQADHAALRQRHEQVGRKACQIRPRPEFSKSELELAAIPGRGDRPDGSVSSLTTTANPYWRKIPMNRIKNVARTIARHRWASAGLVALATLLARDPGVQGLVSASLSKIRQASASQLEGRDPNGSGYVRYAAMIQAGDDLEKARQEYNQGESSLKGDALLEAQDRLRAAKTRHRKARIEFLPELVRQCREAGLPVPKQAQTEYLALSAETRE